jgi:hypothetical protein
MGLLATSEKKLGGEGATWRCQLASFCPEGESGSAVLASAGAGWAVNRRQINA